MPQGCFETQLNTHLPLWPTPKTRPEKSFILPLLSPFILETEGRTRIHNKNGKARRRKVPRRIRTRPPLANMENSCFFNSVDIRVLLAREWSQIANVESLCVIRVNWLQKQTFHLRNESIHHSKPYSIDIIGKLTTWKHNLRSRAFIFVENFFYFKNISDHL